MRVLVCGGRTYADQETVDRVLDGIGGIDLIITGAATGADQRGATWAQLHGVQLCEYPPAWGKYGRAAGPIRNAAMLKFSQPDLVVAFPGGAGTRDMVNKARAAHFVVKEGSPRFDPQEPSQYD